MDYGVTEKGFVKKPYEVIVEEIEADYVRIFGNSINLAAQSPQGQMIGITAEAIYDTWEMAEAVYGSYNIDDVAGLLLDSRAELRGMDRFENEDDVSFRSRLKEKNPNNVLMLRDELYENLVAIDGVEDVVVKYAQGVTKAYVVGGEDVLVASTILDYMPPGALEGNVSVAVSNRCNGVKFFRPTFKQVKIFVEVTHFAHLECECSAIDIANIKKAILENTCGVGYGEYLHEDYIRNILAQFRGLKILNIDLRPSLTNGDCSNELDFGANTEIVEVESFEKVILCDENIVVYDTLNKPRQEDVASIVTKESLFLYAVQESVMRVSNGI